MRLFWIVFPLAALLVGCTTGTMDQALGPDAKPGGNTGLMEYPQHRFAIARPPPGWRRTATVDYEVAAWTNRKTGGRMAVSVVDEPTLNILSWAGWDDLFLASVEEDLRSRCKRFAAELEETFEQGNALNGFRGHVESFDCIGPNGQHREGGQAIYLLKGKPVIYWITLAWLVPSHDSDVQALEGIVRSFRFLDNR